MNSFSSLKRPKALWTFSLKLFRCTQSFSDIVNHDKIHAFEVVLGNMKPKLPKSYILSRRRRLCQDPEDVQLIRWAKFQYYERNEGNQRIINQRRLSSCFYTTILLAGKLDTYLKLEMEDLSPHCLCKNQFASATIYRTHWSNQSCSEDS